MKFEEEYAIAKLEGTASFGAPHSIRNIIFLLFLQRPPIHYFVEEKWRLSCSDSELLPWLPDPSSSPLLFLSINLSLYSTPLPPSPPPPSPPPHFLSVSKPSLSLSDFFNLSDFYFLNWGSVYCGRGDKKTARGKRFNHSFGNVSFFFFF